MRNQAISGRKPRACNGAGVMGTREEERSNERQKKIGGGRSSDGPEVWVCSTST
jgi:hypothetical protein